MKHRIILLPFLLVFVLFSVSARFVYAEDKVPGVHGNDMEHCMPGMEAHCAMQKEMDAMKRDMESIKDMEHCMPDMPVHCQDIADMEYMRERMKKMEIYMLHCMEKTTGRTSCPMPEMTGEMKSMRKKMQAMMRKAGIVSAEEKEYRLEQQEGNHEK